MQRYLGGGQLPPRASWREVIIGFVGGTLGVGGLYCLSLITEYPILLAPFGASCVLLFAASKAPLAQPRNVMGGYLIATLVGLAFAYGFGDHPVAIALSVGLSIALMQLTRMLHPPAGAVPLVIMLAGGPLSTPIQTMISIFLGATFLVGLAMLLNGLGKDGRWPHYWWGNKADK